MSLNLLAHCGADYVDRNALTGVVLPAGTRSHQPVGHDYFVDLIEDKLNDLGLHVRDQAFALTKDGANMFGMMELAEIAEKAVQDDSRNHYRSRYELLLANA